MAKAVRQDKSVLEVQKKKKKSRELKAGKEFSVCGLENGKLV